MVYCFTRDDLPWIDLQHSFCMKLFLDPIVIHRRSVKEHASKKRARERERESDRERSEKEKEMFVCVQLATMPDHACVVERRFFANDSLLKCRRSSSSHGCFARLSMHRVFSTELSIALTDAEDFFKCIQAAVSWEIDRSIERERERELFLGKTVQLLEHVWRPPVVFSQLLEYACRKNLWSSSCSFLRSVLLNMRHESAGLQKSGNLEVDRKLPSTLQTQHQLRACTLAGSVAKNKVQAEARKKKQKNEEEEESESEEAEARRRRRRRGVSSSQKQRWIHNVFDVILDQYCRPQCL
jgi:sRNA-binding protein